MTSATPSCARDPSEPGLTIRRRDVLVRSVIRRRHRAVLLALLTLTVLFGPGLSSIHAHPRRAESPVASAEPVRLAEEAPSTPATTPAQTAAPAPPAAAPKGVIEVALLLVATLVCLLRWPATTARLLLALLVTVVGVESALHSVHHLGNPQGAKTCTVLSVTTHLPGEMSPEVPSGVPVQQYRRHDARAASPAVVSLGRHSDRGRAPPFPLA